MWPWAWGAGISEQGTGALQGAGIKLDSCSAALQFPRLMVVASWLEQLSSFIPHPPAAWAAAWALL